MKSFWIQIQDALKEGKKFPLFGLAFLSSFSLKKKGNLAGLGLIFLILIMVISLNFNTPKTTPSELTLSKNLIYPITSQNDEDLFLSPAIFQREYPDLSSVQGNSLVGFSSHLLISPQILAMKTAAELEAPGEIIEYQVQRGDNLWSIAAEFDISLDTILWANNLNQNSIIKVGQKLIILPASGVMHLVKSGDTLGQIAKIYKGDIEEIIAFNNLFEDGEIYIGDILIIPGGKMPTVLQTFSVPLASSYFIFPCQGRVSQGLHWYNAIDVADKCGSPIFAAAEGTVQKIGWARVGGNYVRILHPNGVVTYYGHLSKILAKAGQKVSQGALIGYMGETGSYATGCHLHFDVRGARNPLIKYPVGSYLTWK